MNMMAGVMHEVVLSFVYAVVILTVSFFVLLANKKSDSQWLKIFGYVVAVLLWVSAALLLGGGFRGGYSRGSPMFPEKCPCPMMDNNMGKMAPIGDKTSCGDQSTFPEMRGGMDGKMKKMAPLGGKAPQQMNQDELNKLESDLSKAKQEFGSEAPQQMNQKELGR